MIILGVDLCIGLNIEGYFLFILMFVVGVMLIFFIIVVLIFVKIFLNKLFVIMILKWFGFVMKKVVSVLMCCEFVLIWG